MPPRFLHPAFPLALSVVFVAASEILLKLGATASVDAPGMFGWTGLASPWVWGGIVAVVLSFATWLAAIQVLPLSLAFLASNVIHVLVPLGSWLFLGETISPKRWIGITLVLVGLLILAKPFARREEAT
jgi:drug/metabolite transporter (DMT)-like permease